MERGEKVRVLNSLRGDCFWSNVIEGSEEKIA